MDTIEKLCQEVESVLNGINAVGIANADQGIIDKIEKISDAAGKLGMTAGKKLIDNLLASLKSFKEGKSNEDSVSLRLTALDFYNKKILSEHGEDSGDL